jgi:hypothetical protein
MNISPSAANPILHYKLDPGEWGSSAPATAGTSIMRVATHESANIQRFEKEALKKGCYVVAKDLYLNLQQDGMYLVATSGRSEVFTYCPRKAKEEQVKGDLGSMLNSKLNQYQREQLNLDLMVKTARNETEKSLYENKLKQIEDRKLKLQQEKLRLYTEVTLLLAQNLPVNPSTISVDLMA